MQWYENGFVDLAFLRFLFIVYRNTAGFCVLTFYVHLHWICLLLLSTIIFVWELGSFAHDFISVFVTQIPVLTSFFNLFWQTHSVLGFVAIVNSHYPCLVFFLQEKVSMFWGWLWSWMRGFLPRYFENWSNVVQVFFEMKMALNSWVISLQVLCVRISGVPNHNQFESFISGLHWAKIFSLSA